jgi:hypothetical protein
MSFSVLATAAKVFGLWPQLVFMTKNFSGKPRSQCFLATAMLHSKHQGDAGNHCWDREKLI